MTSAYPEPLVHVGFYKTGTTWLQNQFFRPRNGFYTAQGPMEVQRTLIDPLPFEFRGDLAREEFLAALEGRGDLGGKVPVVTSEALAGHILVGGYNSKLMADRLAETHPGAKILMVVREQKALIRSLYYTMVLSGLPLSIRQLMDVDRDMLRRGPMFNLNFLRFDLLATYYGKLFGADHVLVLPFELFREQPRVFLDRIHQHAHGESIPASALRKNALGRQVNDNASLTFITLQRWANALLVRSPLNATGLLKETDMRFFKRSLRLRRSPARTPLDGWLERRFARIVEEGTRGAFARSNAALQQLCDYDLSAYGYEM